MAKKVIITGVFGDPWLSELYKSAIGPSLASYHMPGTIDTDTLPDDLSALVLVHGQYQAWSGMRSIHGDGSVCHSYPCDRMHDRHYHVDYAPSQAYVPVYAIKIVD